MSSTNRSSSRDAHISDYYITPVSDIRLFLREFDSAVNLDWTRCKILDPCAGGDNNNPMSYPSALRNEFDVMFVDTIDIRDDSLAHIKRDYLEYDVDDKPDIVITNPPFKYAQNIIQKSLIDVKDSGWVVMLLRLNFFGSKQRKPFWDKFMPRYVFVHHKRIGFIEGGGTDSIEYAHFCWQKGNYPKFCELKVI